MKIISILGSTGSIGKSTLSVINLHPEKFKVFALGGFNNIDLLLEQTIKFKPSFIVTKDLVSKKQLMDKLKETKLDTEFFMVRMDIVLLPLMRGDNCCSCYYWKCRFNFYD